MARSYHCGAAGAVLEQLAPDFGDAGDAGGVGVNGGEDHPPGGAGHPGDKCLRKLAQVGLHGSGVGDGEVHRDALAEHVGHQALPVRPAPVDRRLVDPGTPGDVLDGQRRIPGVRQLGQRRGEDRGPHLRPAARRPRRFA